MMSYIAASIFSNVNTKVVMYKFLDQAFSAAETDPSIVAIIPESPENVYCFSLIFEMILLLLARIIFDQCYCFVDYLIHSSLPFASPFSRAFGVASSSPPPSPRTTTRLSSRRASSRAGCSSDATACCARRSSAGSPSTASRRHKSRRSFADRRLALLSSFSSSSLWRCVAAVSVERM